jgi:hypothetical protein
MGMQQDETSKSAAAAAATGAIVRVTWARSRMKQEGAALATHGCMGHAMVLARVCRQVSEQKRAAGVCSCAQRFSTEQVACRSSGRSVRR